MARSFSLKLMLFSAAAAATIVACGGDDASSKTPGPGQTARAATSQAVSTAGAVQTAAPGSTSAPAVATAAAVNTTTAATVAAAAGASVVPGAAPTQVIPPDVTVLPDGTAVNAEGTPVDLPTAAPVATPVPGTTPTAAAVTTPGAQPTSDTASGTTISFEPPATPGGDFDVNILITGVTKPYVAFNVYVTFDPAIVSAIVIKPGTALSASPDDMFCARAPQTTGAVGLGCTVISGPSAATNGLLATIRFRQVASGTTALHLKTVAEGGATTGTYTSTPAQGAQPIPDIVTLIDSSFTIP